MTKLAKQQIENRKYEILNDGFKIIKHGDKFLENIHSYEEFIEETTKFFNRDNINLWGNSIIKDFLTNEKRDGVLNQFMSIGHRQKEYGEVFTPNWLVVEILNKLEKHDEEFFKNPQHTVIDFAAGVGNLLIDVIDRFFIGTRELYDSDDACLKHILEHQIYAIEIQPSNYIVLKKMLDKKNLVPNNPHIVCADATNFDFWEKSFFDMSIINPPYSKTTFDVTGRFNFSDLYQYFSYLAENISSRYVINIIPAKSLYNKNEFSKYLIYHNNIVDFTVFMNQKDVFSALISGGILYYILDKKYNNNNKVYVEEIGYDGTRRCGTRNVYDFNNEYPRSLLGCEIINKVRKKCSLFFNKLSFLSYEVPTNYKTPHGILKEDCYEVICSHGRSEYIEKRMINDKNDTIKEYKYIFTKSSPGELTPKTNGKINVLMSQRIVDKGVLFSKSYLCLYHTEEKEVIENVSTFFNTKFAQYLILQGIPNHHIAKKSLNFLPVLDFTKTWTDDKLFEYFELTEEEIEEIERMVDD